MGLSFKQQLLVWLAKFRAFLENPNNSSRDKIVEVHGNQESNHHVRPGTSGIKRPKMDRTLFARFMDAASEELLDIIWADMDAKYEVVKKSSTHWIVITPRTEKEFGCGVAAEKRCNKMRMDNMRHTFIHPWRDHGMFKLPKSHR